YTNPTTGGDALPTIRIEMHRLRTGAVTRPTRTTASSVWQVFAGAGVVTLDGVEHALEHGDVFVIPSWTETSLHADTQLDVFCFSDVPVFEKLSLLRTETSS